MALQPNSAHSVVCSKLLLQVMSPGPLYRYSNFLIRPNRCGNVAAIFELDEHLSKNYPIFEAAPNVSCFPFVCLFF